MKKITMKQLQKAYEIGKEAIKDVPVSHTRVREEQENLCTIKYIKKLKGQEIELDKIKNKKVVFVESTNLGTKKWSHMIDYLYVTSNVTYERETENFYVFTDNNYKNSFKVAKHRIIAVI